MPQEKNYARKGHQPLQEDKREKSFASWKIPEEAPDDTNKLKMPKEALKIALKVVMESHVYVFGTDTKLQRKGGPIGLDLTGKLAQISSCGGIKSSKQ